METAHAEGKGTTARDALQALNALYDDLAYEDALEQIRLARGGPRSKREDMLLSLYEGILLCELGQQPQGELSFREALLVRQDVKLPVQVSPKIEQVFESVRQQVKAEQPTSPVRSEGLAARTSKQPTEEVSAPSTDVEPESAPESPRRVASSRPPSFGIKKKDSVECQAAVFEQCQQLMKRLLHLQEEFLRTNPPVELPAVRELVTTGQQIRSASDASKLQEAEANLDYWEALYITQP